MKPTETNDSELLVAERTDRNRVKIGPRTAQERRPEIRLQKKGGVIESIKVVCSCGEEVVIDCVYPDVA